MVAKKLPVTKVRRASREGVVSRGSGRPSHESARQQSTCALEHSLAERKVLARITPPKQLPLIIAVTIKRVERAIKEELIAASIMIGGSTAKGTYLKGDHDVDVFVRFSTAYDDAALAEHLDRILCRVFGKRVERVHGSRDYFHVLQGSFLFEFIPVLDIVSWQEARNVTDMSPLHVAYVTQHVVKRPYLSQEIRLTKQFCKAAKMYGAESYIGGFSGHVVDLLNIHYGGFHELLRAAAAWPAKVIIDPEHRLGNPLLELNDAKTFAPLVIVDPVQQDRNSAAALSKGAFELFKRKAKEYLDAPVNQQELFFTVMPLERSHFAKEHPASRIITVSLVPLRGKKDVVGAKCLKVFEHCTNSLLAHGFFINASTWEFSTSKTLLFFSFPTALLSVDEHLVGPPVHKTADVARFLAAHKMTFSKDGRVHAVERRKYRDPKKLLQAIIKERYVRDRVKTARCT